MRTHTEIQWRSKSWLQIYHLNRICFNATLCRVKALHVLQDLYVRPHKVNPHFAS